MPSHNGSSFSQDGASGKPGAVHSPWTTHERLPIQERNATANTQLHCATPLRRCQKNLLYICKQRSGRAAGGSRRHDRQLLCALPEIHRRRSTDPKTANTMKLRSDPLLDEVARLAPEFTVSGGCFRHWLSNPSAVSPSDRNQYLERARADAINLCLNSLLKKARLPSKHLNRQPSGARGWPSGYVGSISHKGTKVAAAIASTSIVRSIGIDIETRSGTDQLIAIPGLIGKHELPPELTVGGEVILFSTKEAIFKASSSVLARPLDFEDVSLSWTKISDGSLCGVGRCDEITFDVRCSTAVPSWIVSVALLLA